MAHAEFASALKARLFARPATKRAPTFTPGTIHRAAPVGVLKYSSASRRFSCVCSTSRRDRYGDVIEQRGWKLANYKRNPVLCWAHDARAMPIGRTTYIAVERDQLVAECELADTPTANEAARLIEAGVLRGISVGFDALEWTWLPDDSGVRFTSMDLAELSLCPVPANPDCLVAAPTLSGKHAPDPVQQPRLAARARGLALARLRA